MWCDEEPIPALVTLMAASVASEDFRRRVNRSNESSSSSASTFSFSRSFLLSSLSKRLLSISLLLLSRLIDRLVNSGVLELIVVDDGVGGLVGGVTVDTLLIDGLTVLVVLELEELFTVVLGTIVELVVDVLEVVFVVVGTVTMFEVVVTVFVFVVGVTGVVTVDVRRDIDVGGRDEVTVGCV